MYACAVGRRGACMRMAIPLTPHDVMPCCRPLPKCPECRPVKGSNRGECKRGKRVVACHKPGP